MGGRDARVAAYSTENKMIRKMQECLHISKNTRTFALSFRKNGSLKRAKNYIVERPNRRKDNSHAPMSISRWANQNY